MERKTLIHKYPGMSDEDFFQEIDKTGGWPVGYKFVSFYHAIEYKDRYCMFGNTELRNGSWTTITSSDEYYWWKISASFKQDLKKKTYREIGNQLCQLS